MKEAVFQETLTDKCYKVSAPSGNGLRTLRFSLSAARSFSNFVATEKSHITVLPEPAVPGAGLDVSPGAVVVYLCRLGARTKLL